LADENIGAETIAEELKRSVPALRARAYAIGLPLKWFKLKREAAGVPPIDPPPSVQKRKLTPSDATWAKPSRAALARLSKGSDDVGADFHKQASVGLINGNRHQHPTSRAPVFWAILLIVR
jgi:hypothetical protein